MSLLDMVLRTLNQKAWDVGWTIGDNLASRKARAKVNKAVEKDFENEAKQFRSTIPTSAAETALQSKYNHCRGNELAKYYSELAKADPRQFFRLYLYLMSRNDPTHNPYDESFIDLCVTKHPDQLQAALAHISSIVQNSVRDNNPVLALIRGVAGISSDRIGAKVRTIGAATGVALTAGTQKAFYYAGKGAGHVWFTYKAHREKQNSLIENPNLPDKLNPEDFAKRKAYVDKNIKTLAQLRTYFASFKTPAALDHYIHVAGIDTKEFVRLYLHIVAQKD